MINYAMFIAIKYYIVIVLFFFLNKNNIVIYIFIFLKIGTFQEQIKWDKELMNTVVLIIVSICLNFNEFYNIFCAIILNTSVFLKLSMSEM